MSILENLYYGNIHPNKHSFPNGGNNSELIENAVRLEKELRAALTERQKTCSNSSKRLTRKFPTGTGCKRLQTGFAWRLC